MFVPPDVLDFREIEKAGMVIGGYRSGFGGLFSCGGYIRLPLFICLYIFYP